MIYMLLSDVRQGLIKLPRSPVPWHAGLAIMASVLCFFRRSVELTGHLYPLTALHFTPNSKRLLSAGASTMLLWALEGRLERPKAEVLRSRIL
jgi:hypothetical protein